MTKISVRFQRSSVIRVLVDHNPRRVNTEAFRKFALYRDGMTLDQALEAGLNTADIRYDVERGHVALAATT